MPELELAMTQSLDRETKGRAGGGMRRGYLCPLRESCAAFFGVLFLHPCSLLGTVRLEGVLLFMVFQG